MRKWAVLLLVMACSKAKEPPAPAPTPTPGPAVVAAADAGAAADAPVIAVAVDAGAPAIPCTAADLKAARKTADGHVKAKEYDKAVALLKSITCWIEEDQPKDVQEQIAWRHSDLAFAEYKAGKPEDCYMTAASHFEPYTGNVAAVFDQDSPVMKALTYNAGLCRKAAEKKRGEFKEPTACEMLADEVLAATDEDDRGPYAAGIPGENACILVAAPTTNAEGDPVCGRVFYVKAGKGKPTRSELTFDGDELAAMQANLFDSGVCCNAGIRGFQKRATGLAMLVTSDGRNCEGGTASTSEEHVYELVGTKLRLVHQLDSAAH